MDFIKASEREEALMTVLNLLVDLDIDLKEIQSYAEEEEEMWMVKCIKKFISENFGEEEEQEEW